MFTTSQVSRLLRGAAAALFPLVLAGATLSSLTYSPLTAAQLACPADGGSICKSTRFCLGMNTGFFSYSSMDRPFIDQMRGAGVSVATYDPGSILRNPQIPLDANKYPTVADREVSVLFYTVSATIGSPPSMPAGRYVVLWEGSAVNPNMKGGVSDVVVEANRIEFTLDPTIQQNTRFLYTNGASDHVRNIRIVPKRYETAYANWNWSNYQVGAASNPPIFFPEWLSKMSSACAIRYMNGLNANDRDVVTYKRDSSKTRIKPGNSVWYDGFGLGSNANSSHVWPWELIVESSLQTDTRPWINFRVYAWDNMKNGDTIITDIADLFERYWQGIVYIEYGNEIWNTAWPFNVATNWVAQNGPNPANDPNINYSLRNNDIQKWFADAYGAHACKAVGVAASQGRFPFRGQVVLDSADLDYVDLITPTTYVGDDISPIAPDGRWNWIEGLYDEVEAGSRSKADAFNEIKKEILDGEQSLVTKNWRNDVKGFTQQYIDMAKDRNMCSAFYEGGLHMRVNSVDTTNPKHFEIAKFVREYQQSQQQADVEKEINDYLVSRSTGPNLVYANFIAAGRGTFSYWDTVFDSPASYGQRARLLASYGDGGGTARPDGGTTDGGTTDGGTTDGGTTDGGTTDGGTTDGGTTDGGTTDGGTTDGGTTDGGTTDGGTTDGGTTDGGTTDDCGTTDGGTTDGGTTDGGTTDGGTTDGGTTDGGTTDGGTTDGGTTDGGTTDGGTTDGGTTDGGTTDGGTTDGGTTDGGTTDGGTTGGLSPEDRAKRAILKLTRKAQRRVARLDDRFFKRPSHKAVIQRVLDRLIIVTRKRNETRATAIIDTLVNRLDGCGRQAKQKRFNRSLYSTA